MLKAKHILCLLCLAFTLSHAQKPFQDSLKRSSSAFIERIQTASPEEITTFENTFFAIQNKDEHWVESALELAYHFYKKEKFQQSLVYTNAAIEVSNILNDNTLLAKCYLRKGNIYKQQGKNENALEAYYTLLEFALKADNVNYQLLARMNIAVIHRMMQQYEKALQACTEALQSIHETKYYGKKNHVNLLTILSETHLNMENYDAALHHIETGLTMSDTLNYTLGKVDLGIKKGIIHYKKEAYNLALEYLYKADELLKNDTLTNDFHQKIYANYFISACLYQQKKYQKTVDRLQESITILKKDPKRDTYVLDTYLLLSKSYNKLKNTEQTLHWHDEYIILNEVLEKDKNKLQNIIYEKETQYFKDEIARLKKEKEKGNTMIWYVVIFAAIVSVIGVLIVFRSIKKQQSSKETLQELTSTINVLATQNKKLTTKKTPQKLFDIEDEKVHSILKKIAKLEASEYYLNLECSLSAMAKKLKTNRSYLSQIIKTHKKKRFNDYINDLRIDYTLDRLKNDKKFRLFSVTSIAKEVGYKSDYSLVKHFKERTGVKPSNYIKNLLDSNS
ncbi:helix-turn-helix domain-containing protein [Kordia sp. YSTF-M3]|uniref:Helix-turn-helix domain-containing protein n=1 Tax=Kordia aestuariivivens TaxID=2759037 RepID=A0ABR7QFP2_9FLAO|nr:helix-turn-helix domain-containing protein [Kordia aestuariivivens]MBC8757394.1 helix-turn-helix domain-containing protein [Kordia aestuariivivens]